jgi:hypothetical protein
MLRVQLKINCPICAKPDWCLVADDAKLIADLIDAISKLLDEKESTNNLKEILKIKTELLECYREDYRAAFNRCKDLITTNNMLVDEIAESEAQIKKLQEDVNWLEENA